ncbi:unnamed protein product [Vicia faba]|uniref:Uncharacterized protein n=1 Tax=Vicia faba TaxID=3906 RepID=A0AAV0ZUG0_VICFA|nr:unnamed protein product [Vicia faba]
MCHFSLVGKIVLNADFLSKGAIHRSFSKGRACRRTILGHSNFQGGYAYAWLPSPTEHYLPWCGIKFNYLLSSPGEKKDEGGILHVQAGTYYRTYDRNKNEGNKELQANAIGRGVISS